MPSRVIIRAARSCSRSPATAEHLLRLGDTVLVPPVEHPLLDLLAPDQACLAEQPQMLAAGGPCILECHASAPMITWRVSAGRSVHGAWPARSKTTLRAVSYTHLRAHETRHDLVCRLLLE